MSTRSMRMLRPCAPTTPPPACWAQAAEPLVVVIEDVHWSDVSSLRMLTYAAEALRERPVLFVVTVRSEASPRPALTEALAGFSRLGARRLALSPLRVGRGGRARRGR